MSLFKLIKSGLKDFTEDVLEKPLEFTLGKKRAKSVAKEIVRPSKEKQDILFKAETALTTALTAGVVNPELLTFESGTLDNRFLSGATKTLGKASTALGVFGTTADILAEAQSQKEEQEISGKVDKLSKVVSGIGKVLEITTNKEQKEIKELGKNLSKTSKDIKKVETSIKTLKELQEQENKEFMIKQEETLTGIAKEFDDIKKFEQTQQIDEQHFEQKLLNRVEQEEERLVGVIDDLAERLEESNIKNFNFEEFVDFINRLEADDIVDFLARQEKDFNKLTKSQQQQLLDLAIAKGV